MINLFNARGQSVGTYDEKTKTYETIRDADKGQIFLHPKRRGDLAIDSAILVQLMKLGCQKVRILVLNFETKPFWVSISLGKFLNDSEPINFDKKIEHTQIETFYSRQRKLNLSEFMRDKDPRQKVLSA